MKNNYDDLDKALNIESSIVEVEKSTTSIDIIPAQTDDIKKDYEYTRANLYSLIEKGQEAINGIMELAGDGGSPRAYEVVAGMIKNISEVTKELIDLQKKMKELNEDTPKSSSGVNVQNAVFVGSTAELQKLLRQNKEQQTDG